MNKDYYTYMKRYLVALVLLIGIVNASDVSAQIKKRPARSPLPDSYQEYIYNLNLFYNDRKQFESDKSKYLAYKTVQSKEDALSSTVTMLESGRVSMLRYLDIVEADLQKQDEFNSRVKNAVLNDITIHKTFLNDSQPTISSVTSLEQGVTVSSALNLRYNYLKSTTNQSLIYRDVVTTKKQNDLAREITIDFKNIVAGYPPDNRNRETVDKWADEMIAELADNERILNEIIETMYPAVIRDNRPIYERSQPAGSSNLSKVNTRLRQYTVRFTEIKQIAQEAYREL
jgi:hypothetical protein